MAVEIRIHPHDLEPDVAIGIDLPLVKGVGSDFVLNYTTLDQAVANCKNLLLTNKGERIMHPDFGCDLGRFIFSTCSPEQADVINRGIRSNFKQWLAYVYINELEVIALPDNRMFKIEMIVSLDRNRLDTRSIQTILQLGNE